MYAKQIIERMALMSHAPDTLDSRLIVHRAEVNSPSLGSAVAVSALENGQPPEVVFMHLDGGIGDRESLVNRKRTIALMTEAGLIPTDALHVSFSGGSSAFYTGAWESWVVDELPRWIHQQFGVATARENLLLIGISGGGHGALKIAFKHPHSFKAVAALEPVIMPSLSWPEQHTRASWWLLEPSARAVWGEPFPESFLENHPPNLAMARAHQLRASGLDIYLEAGDEDLLMLQDGAEFLHRVLWKQDIPHEFHQVRWADHGGHSIDDRFIEAMAFLHASYKGGKKQSRSLELSAGEQRFVDYVLGGGPTKGEPMPAEASQGTVETELSVMARLWEPLREIAASRDPAMARHYGPIPPIAD